MKKILCVVLILICLCSFTACTTKQAAEAIREYEKWSANFKYSHEYQYEEYELDKIWEDR